MSDVQTYEPNQPEPMTWAGVDMWRCPFERCGFSHEERDEVVEHIEKTGHIGPDPEDDEPEVIPTESDTAAPATYNNDGEGGKS